MNDDDEAVMYRETLEKGLYVLSQAIGVDCEYFDTDQADVACYLDCFNQAAELIKKYDASKGEFVANKSRITLTGQEVLDLSEFVCPDKNDTCQLETEVTILYRDDVLDSEGNLLPAGHYCFLTEYYEEGIYGPLGEVK